MNLVTCGAIVFLSASVALALRPGSLSSLGTWKHHTFDHLAREESDRVFRNARMYLDREPRTITSAPAGMVCLAIGMLHATAAGLISWLVLRRGFATGAVSAGLAACTLAGLAGVEMLELHCPNFQAARVLVWHVGVLLASAGLGAVAGW